jgi:hypothetical protein
LTKALIENELALPTAPYCGPSCPEYNLSKIVDGSGRNAGLSTLTDALVDRLQDPSRVALFRQTPVTQIDASGSGTYRLHLGGVGPSSATASAVILNLPAQPLLTLLRRSPTLGRAADTNQLRALHFSRGADAVKLYLYYEDAWWRTALNRTEGYFNNSCAQESNPAASAACSTPARSSGRGDLMC